MNPVLVSLLSGIGLAAALFFFSWFFSMKFKNGAIADITWSIGFTVLTVFYCLTNEGWFVRQAILGLIVSFWSLRLGFYLAVRTIKHLGKEDTRYKHLRDQASINPKLYFLWIFMCQALLQAVVTVPFIISAQDPQTALRLTEVLGLLLFFPAFFGEMLADKQLDDFKKDPANTGTVCKVGLWRFSRHPNYFFEWLIWCSFSLFAIASPYGIWSIISPLIMLHMLLNVSGVKISEEVSLKSRGDAYKQYQKETSPFFPWFPKRST